MKYLLLAFLVAATFFLGWSCCRQYKADQGFVQSDDGREWKLKRMQTFGMGSEFIAVYEETR